MTASGQVEGRRRGRPSTGVRDAVIAAAERILAEEGVARLSTKGVADRAGVAESSIFYHFRDRTGLLQAVVQRHLRPVKDVLGDVGAHRDLRADLVALMEALEDFFVATIPVAAAIQSDAELRARYLDRAQEADIGPHRAVDAMQARLAAARPSASSAVNLRAAALLLVGAAHQRALQRHLSPASAFTSLPSPADIVDTVLPLFG
ncbi:TetR/AcrR family transcriptional regulator [Nocardia araoensis]|uniref:TetR/AcrR family transcriptional regulator n=1 Tax=Nocardia araoensis TaxID=228600 RepID=UPI0002EF19BA|nr:TetR/AcrR family transcriptional regulator [Nocardia araoensis]